MVGKRNKLVYTTILAFLLVIPFALGVNILDQILRPFSGTNIGQTYTQYAYFIDAILYFWLFIGISKTIIGEKVFPDAKNKTIPTAMGVILAIGMSVFEYQTGFNLGKLAPLAALIFFIILGMAIYKWMKEITGDEAKGGTIFAFSLAFLIIYAVANSAAPSFIQWIEQVEWLGTILAIMFIIAIIGLIYGIINFIGSIKTGSWSLGRSERDAERSGRAYKDHDNKITNNIRREQDAAKKIANLNNQLQNLNNSINQASQIEANIHNSDLSNRSEQIKLLMEIEQAINGSWRLQTELQQLLSNSSKPEYQNNPEFQNVVHTTSNQLLELVNKVNFLLTKLHDGVKRTSDNQLKEDEAEGSLKNKIADLENTLKTYNELITELNQAIQRSRDNNMPAEEERALNTLQQMMEDRKNLFAQLKSTNEQLRLIRDEIRKNDTANIKDLENAIVVSTQDPTKELSKLSRAFNAASNYTSRPESSAPSTKFSGLVNTVGDVLNVWYKYIQSGSMRQIYQQITNVHARLEQYVSKLSVDERNQITQRNEAIKKIIQSHASSDQISSEAIKTQITKLKALIQQNGTFTEDLANHLGYWLEELAKLRGNFDVRKEKVLSLPSRPSRIVTNQQTLFQQLQKYIDASDVLTDKAHKQNMIAEIKVATGHITQFMNDSGTLDAVSSIGFQTASKSKYEKGLEKLRTNMMENVASERQKLQILDDLLKIENILEQEAQMESRSHQNINSQEFGAQSQPLKNNEPSINLETEQAMEKEARNTRKTSINRPQFKIEIDDRETNTLKADKKEHKLTITNLDNETLIYQVESKFIIPNSLSHKYFKKEIKLGSRKSNNLIFTCNLERLSKGALLVYVAPASSPKNSITNQIIITK